MEKGDGVRSIELAPPGEGEAGDTSLETRPKRPASPEPRCEIAIAVLVAFAVEAVDPGGPLECNTAFDFRVARYECPGSGGAPRAKGSCFGARGVGGFLRSESVDGDHSANRVRAPERRLRPSYDFESVGEVRVEKFEPRRVVGCGIVGADSVDKKQGVVGFRSANPDFGEAPRGAARFDRRRRG